MAHIIPSDISRLALAGAHAPELETLRLLKSALPDDYTVFHGVHWSRGYEKWSHFGEIDFVILNRSGDLLFIEQKNGLLEEGANGLVKRYQDGEKNVVDQIHRSMAKVREAFKLQHGKKIQLSVDCLIYCPDYRVVKLNAAGLDARRIVDAAARDGLAARIESLLGPGRLQNDGRHDTIRDFFCQTYRVVPDIHAHIGAQQKGFVRQVGPLASVLTNLEMTPFRLRVTGTAGSGKSLVAREFFARSAAAGKRVLLTCYNRPLAERLKHSVGESGHVNTWYGFCHAFLESRGHRLDFDRMKRDPRFWQEVQERVTAEPIPDEWLFDTLIVDEGQDFEAEWFEILQLFLRDGADLLWLEDPAQNLRGKPGFDLPGFVRYRSPINYRSPASIARFIRNTLPFEFEPGNGLPGLGVGVHPWKSEQEQSRIVATRVQDLVRQGFSHDDIVVLTCRGANNSLFSTLEQVGSLKLRRFTGEYDQHGNQLSTDGRLTFDSIYRFKGQEAPAVILVDIDPDPRQRERMNRLLFCGMTRATVRLELVVREGNPANRIFFEQATGG